MHREMLRSRAIYVLQNGMAVGLFGLLFIAEASAYLLNAYPNWEFTWWLSLNSNRLVGSLLNIGDSVLKIPYLLLAILAASVVLPIIALRRRSWLGTAISGHVALGAGVVISQNALLQVQHDRAVASLSAALDPTIMSPSALWFCTTTLVMLALCVLNHFMFFARIKSNKGE